MSDTFINKDERDWPNERLTVGAIVGHTTERSCRLWIRTGKPGNYTVIYYKRPKEGSAGDLLKGFRKIPYNIDALPRSVKVTLKIEDFKKDTTDVVDLIGLEPDSEYCYALFGLDLISGDRRILLGQKPCAHLQDDAGRRGALLLCPLFLPHALQGREM